MRWFFIILSMFSFAFTGLAQDQFTIQGRVEAPDHEPLIGALVQVTGTTRGASTDVDGSFELQGVSVGDTLLCSFVGYEPKRIPIIGDQALNIQLMPTAELLDELVFTGFSYQKKSEVTGAIASVAPEDMTDAPGQPLERLLQGKAAGVLVAVGNGVPGGNSTVLIRGWTSIDGGTNPLYIVDGVQVNPEPAANNDRLDVSPLSFINPQDIESIEVLKDAASTSIYGSQASNGVILITTKKGRQGKTRFNFSTYQGINTQLKELDFMNSQQLSLFRIEQYTNDARLRGFSNPVGRGRIFGLIETGIDFAEYGVANFADAEEILTEEVIQEYIDELPTYDWFNAPYRDGRVQDYQLSASGGNRQTQFFTSLNFQDTEAQIIGTRFQKGQFRLNVDNQASEKLQISSRINLSSVKQTGDFNRGFWAASPMRTGAVLPWNPIYDEETGEYNEPLLGSRFINQLKEVDYVDVSSRLNQFIGSLQLSYQILPALSYRGVLGMDYRDNKVQFYGDPRTLNYRGSGGRAFASSEETVNFTTSQQLRFQKEFGPLHDFSSYLVWEYRQERFENISASGTGFPNELFRTLSSAAVPDQVNSSFTEWKNVGTLLNVKYSYADRYYLNASIRYDGSSRFGVDNRYGWFPSFSASWRIDQESFFNSRLVSSLKVRAGWGVTGNNRIPNFASRSLITGGGAYLNQSALSIQGLGNNFLSWEEQKEWNVGLDYELWEGKVSGAVDVYSRISDGLLLARNLPFSSGFSSINENVGELLNEGIEFLIDARLISRERFSWRANFNIAFQRQELLSLYEDQQSEADWLQVGNPINSWYTFDYAGINPANGRPFWYDRNGNLSYRPEFGNSIGDENDDRKVMGLGIPTSFGGLNSTVTLGGFSLDAFFNFTLGRSAIENSQFEHLNSQIYGSNQQVALLSDAWEKPGDISRYPIPMINPLPGFNLPWFSMNLQRTDFIRLKTLTLSYNFPRNLLEGVGLQNLRIYVRGTNLVTWTGYVGLDPEFTGPADWYNFPNSKSYLGGIEVQF